MKIRNKILIYFSSTVIALSAVSLTLIYILFSEYREEEFQQRQKVKIKHTIGLLNEYKEMSENLAEIMDKQTIHDFFDEKMLVFDKDKDLVYSSLDNLTISGYKTILHDLSPANTWIETKEGDYDVVGLYTESRGKEYYAISKAFDDFGYSKLYFLRNVLITIFAAITLIVVLVSFYLSKKISKPITRLAENLNKYRPGNKQVAVLEPDTSSYELQHLTSRFNELLTRTNEAFDFQKNAIQHISHELKTPVAVLVSDLEKIESLTQDTNMKRLVGMQVDKAKSLGNIIHVLLETSKVDSGQEIRKQNLRIDEILFDLIEQLQTIHPDFHFDVNFIPETIDENQLLIFGNQMLIKQAFNNLLINCIAYSSQPAAAIEIDCRQENALGVIISNRGKTLSAESARLLFEHFFRGENSEGKTGFGLGLVLAKKIISMHHGVIHYRSSGKDLNVFEVWFYK